MRKTTTTVGFCAIVFSCGYFLSSYVNSNYSLHASENPVNQNQRMVDGLQLVFVTADGKMVFKRAMVPENTMSAEKFGEMIQKQRNSNSSSNGTE